MVQDRLLSRFQSGEEMKVSRIVVVLLAFGTGVNGWTADWVVEEPGGMDDVIFEGNQFNSNGTWDNTVEVACKIRIQVKVSGNWIAITLWEEPGTITGTDWSHVFDPLDPGTYRVQLADDDEDWMADGSEFQVRVQ